MVYIVIILITLGALGILFTDIVLMCDEENLMCGIMNIIGVCLLCIGICAGFGKTQTVYCPGCGTRDNTIIVNVNEHYCSSCGTEYVVLD